MSIQAFFGEFERAVEQAAFRRLTLAKAANKDETRRNVTLRPVHLGGQDQVQIVERFATRDVTKNVSPSEAIAMAHTLCGAAFLDAHLETIDALVMLRHSRKGVPHLTRQRIDTPRAVVPLGNDRLKKKLLESSQLPWLRDLGIADATGRILPSRSDKWRQMQRFVELLDHAWRRSDQMTRVADMGSGKGYLTFAVHAWMTALGGSVSVTGIEQREELVNLCNSIANRHSLSNLTFKKGAISDLSDVEAEIVIALHACDTATDDALAHGIRSGAKMIVVAPCCQHEIRASMRPSEAIAGLVGHGLLRQRQADLVTDSLRILLLEKASYEVRAVEFVEAEHTAKNLLLIATKRETKSDAPRIETQITDLKRLFGLKSFYLEQRLL
ncbi:MAG TPA: methyltransferase [Chthoniobacterales bacterium]